MQRFWQYGVYLALVGGIFSQRCMGSFGDREFTSEKSVEETRIPTVVLPNIGNYEITSADGEINIPFEMYRGDIRMTVQINGRDCYFLVDNGALWDDLLFFGSPKVDSLGFRLTGEVALGDTAAAIPIIADTADDITVAFKNVIFTNQSAVMYRYIPGLPNLWEGADGQISAAFFINFVVTIDFDRSVLSLIKPENFDAGDFGQPIDMHLGPHNSRTITTELGMQNGGEIALELLVDMGGIHPLYLPIGKNTKIVLPDDAVETSIAYGIMGYIGRISCLRIGEYMLADIPTAFTHIDNDVSIFGNQMLGMPLLRRFNVAFDYPNNRMFLKPNQSFAEPF
jgi:hypothetical protein